MYIKALWCDFKIHRNALDDSNYLITNVLYDVYNISLNWFVADAC